MICVQINSISFHFLSFHVFLSVQLHPETTHTKHKCTVITAVIYIIWMFNWWLLRDVARKTPSTVSKWEIKGKLLWIIWKNGTSSIKKPVTSPKLPLKMWIQQTVNFEILTDIINCHVLIWLTTLLYNFKPYATVH